MSLGHIPRILNRVDWCTVFSSHAWISGNFLHSHGVFHRWQWYIRPYIIDLNVPLCHGFHSYTLNYQRFNDANGPTDCCHTISAHWRATSILEVDVVMYGIQGACAVVIFAARTADILRCGNVSSPIVKTCAELFEHPRVSTYFIGGTCELVLVCCGQRVLCCCVVQCQSCVSQDDTPREGIQRRAIQLETWRRSKKRQSYPKMLITFITIHFQFLNRFISPTALQPCFFGTSLPMHFTTVPRNPCTSHLCTAFQRVVLWVLCVWHILWGWPRKFWGRTWP